jgi:hypothetical protein
LALFDSLIQRLQNTRINGRNHIYRRIQFFLRHSRFPCIRKAPVYSRIAEPHHRHRQANEHLFSVSETLHGMGVAIEGSKISCLQNASLLSDSTPVSGLESGKSPFIPLLQKGERGGIRNSKPET